MILSTCKPREGTLKPSKRKKNGFKPLDGEVIQFFYDIFKPSITLTNLLEFNDPTVAHM